MMVIQCKRCGGDLELLKTGEWVARCTNCGAQITIPDPRQEQMAALLQRADALRRNLEFEKAQMLYERMIDQQPDNAEAHWGFLLTSYGIVYEQQGSEKRWAPTIHLLRYDSIFKHRSWQQLQACARPETRPVYERDAQEIDRLMQKVMETLRRQEAFDVMIICAQDDTAVHHAQEIRELLQRSDIRVFFGLENLRASLDADREAHTFAALLSAKILLVVGTAQEQFQTPVLRSRWRQFQRLMKQDDQKRLITLYRDLEVTALPTELMLLQALDLGQVGALETLRENLLRLLNRSAEARKLTEKDRERISRLLIRAAFLREDGDFQRAAERCSQALEMDSTQAEAYMCRLLSRLHLHAEAQLEWHAMSCYQDPDWPLALKFAAPEQKSRWQNYLYQQAVEAGKSAKTVLEYQKAAAALVTLGDFKQARTLAAQYTAQGTQQTNVYQNALQTMKTTTELEEFYKACRQAKTCPESQRLSHDAPDYIATGRRLFRQQRDRMALGQGFLVGIRKDGSVVCSRGSSAVISQEASGWTDMVQLSAVREVLLGLERQGRVHVAGGSELLQQRIRQWPALQQVAAGWGIQLGVTAEGRIVAEGDEAYGPAIRKMSQWQDVVRAAVSNYAVIALTQGGKYRMIHLQTAQETETNTRMSYSPTILAIDVDADFANLFVIQRNGLIRQIPANKMTESTYVYVNGWAADFIDQVWLSYVKIGSSGLYVTTDGQTVCMRNVTMPAGLEKRILCINTNLILYRDQTVQVWSGFQGKVDLRQRVGSQSEVDALLDLR